MMENDRIFTRFNNLSVLYGFTEDLNRTKESLCSEKTYTGSDIVKAWQMCFAFRVQTERGVSDLLMQWRLDCFARREGSRCAEVASFCLLLHYERLFALP
jgi:hypothetical protein